MAQKATITKKQHDGNIRQNRRAKGFFKQYTVVTKDFKELIVIRCYAAKMTNYACVWIRDSVSQTYIAGGGRCSGYGYDKEVGSIDNALHDAGVRFTQDVNSTHISDTLEAIAEALNYHLVGIIESHS